MEWRSYAAAPLVVGSQVVGVIHADRGPASRSTCSIATSCGRSPPDSPRPTRAPACAAPFAASATRCASSSIGSVRASSELTDAPVTLSAGGHAPPPPPPPLPESAPAGRGRDDRVVFEGLLTRRELDVLRLLADGATNRAVADALVISSGTVKFHVNSILRKLHAANRAEAVTRYLRLMGMRVP